MIGDIGMNIDELRAEIKKRIRPALDMSKEECFKEYRIVKDMVLSLENNDRLKGYLERVVDEFEPYQYFDMLTELDFDIF